MKVNIGILIGAARGKPSGARKTIDLDFVPVEGMYYSDETWKAMEARRIISVLIEHLAVEGSTHLEIGLDEDPHGDPAIYESHGWKIT